MNSIVGTGLRTKDKNPLYSDTGTMVVYSASVVEDEGPGSRTAGRPDEMKACKSPDTFLGKCAPSDTATGHLI